MVISSGFLITGMKVRLVAAGSSGGVGLDVAIR
jgi:hypothetical protein